MGKEVFIFEICPWHYADNQKKSRYEHENVKTGLSSSPDVPDFSPDRCELVLEHDIEYVGDS